MNKQRERRGRLKRIDRAVLGAAGGREIHSGGRGDLGGRGGAERGKGEWLRVQAAWILRESWTLGTLKDTPHAKDPPKFKDMLEVRLNDRPLYLHLLHFPHLRLLLLHCLAPPLMGRTRGPSERCG